jgi:hypothetical protein
VLVYVMWLQRVKAAEIDGEVFATSWLEALAEGAGRRLCIPGYVAVESAKKSGVGVGFEA